jgi:hypothetical protein
MIDLASSDNLLLRLNPEAGYANNEVLISVAYSAMKGASCSSSLACLCSNDFLLSTKKGIIAAGTNRGNIPLWTYTPNRRTVDIEKHWILQRAKSICTGIAVRRLKVCAWSSVSPIELSFLSFVAWYCPQRICLAANLISQVFMLTDENMSAAYRDNVSG